MAYSEEIARYATTVAGAALRHDFGVPLGRVGRNAELIKELLLEDRIPGVETATKAHLIEMCSNASAIESRLQNQLKLFGKELAQSNAAAREYSYARTNAVIAPLLTSLIDYCFSCAKEFGNCSDKDVARWATQMLANANRAQEMYSGLTHFVRIRDIDSTNFRAVRLDDLIGKISGSVVLASGVKTSIHVDGKETVEAIPNNMILLFQNLLSNGLKFTSAVNRPVVGVRLSHCDFAELKLKYATQLRNYETRGEWVEAIVYDNGPGIDAAIMDRIFDLYFTRNPRNIDRGGTGMGLAIARLITIIHRGLIFAQRSENITEFVVALPMQQKDGIIIRDLITQELSL